MQQSTVDEAQTGAPIDDENDEASNKPALDASAIVVALGQRLHGEFKERMGQREEIEKRWLADLERYNSVYDKRTEAALESRKYGSRTFVPITRRICNMVEARLGDLLFPTDERNFSIEASPVPELDEAMALAEKLPKDQPVEQAPPQPEPQPGQQPAPQAGPQPGPQQGAMPGAMPQQAPLNAAEVVHGIREVLDEAKRRATNMQRAIDDQLKECNYPAEARKAIHDAIKLGTGVIKGPAIFGRVKRKWMMVDGGMQLEIGEDLSPAAARVDPWNYYGDLNATEVNECQGHYERHRLSMTRLAALVRQGFDEEAIERIVTAGAMADTSSTLSVQRVAAGTSGIQDNNYNLIEYTGALPATDMVACGCEVPDDALLAYDAKVWFSEATGDVVKVALAPLESGAQPYSVFNWQRDASCIYGFGLPYEIRDMQDGANSIFRAIQDNSGLTVGPQVVVNSGKIQPQNGVWSIEPNKIWDLIDASMPVQNVFGFFQIDSKVNELLAVFNLIKALAEETGGPSLAMAGTEAPSYAQAGAMGMSIAFNAASVWMRRPVKAWDDQVTTPLIGRFVDWNMEHNTDPDVKGDISVIPRGTSALLEAEGQAQRIAMLSQASESMGIPLRRKINQLRQMAQAMRLDPDELLPNDKEVEQMEQQAQQNTPANPELERINIRKMELEDHEKQRQHESKIESDRGELRLAELASHENLSVEEAKLKYGVTLHKAAAELNERQAAREDTNKRFNAEVAVKTSMGSGV